VTLLFWACAGIIVYAYLGYPLLAWVVSRLRPRPVHRQPIEPRVSLVIAAYNEERVIRAKIENTLGLDYPKDLLEVVIVADGSTDGTVDIARGYMADDIVVLHEPGRKGKTSALNRAAVVCTAEILLFSDANTEYRPDVIRHLVRSFADPAVGGVSGRKIILGDAERVATRGETSYWGYESFLKTCESRMGSIVTADGEIFALRASLFEPMPPEIVHDDMYLTLCLVRDGHRVVYDTDAVSGEHASKNLRDEFHLKVRYASAGFQLVARFPRLTLLPTSLFAVQFLSHKVLRWTAPLFLLGLLAASGLAPGSIYTLAWWGQVAFYGAAVVGAALPAARRPKLLYFPLYFAMGNLAALVGIARWLRGGQSTSWRRAER
jgi:cellulose synthase/poly-beta-1,6-N-acetylglucosamine synthase-like glycosyltransferase